MTNDIKNQIEKLNTNSEANEIKKTLELMSQCNLEKLDETRYLKQIKEQTKFGICDLRESYQTIGGKNNVDVAKAMAEKTLYECFDGHLIRSEEKYFWFYNSKNWEPITDEQVSHYILKTVKKYVAEGKYDYNSTKESALKLLQSSQALPNDPLGFRQSPPAIINCKNGEVHIDKDGDHCLKRHDPTSNLKYVLNVDYGEQEDCPLFDQALLDIFAKSSSPEDMRRHFYEVIGYLIQPKRFIDAWFMFIGEGRNGKTSLSETIQHLMDMSAIQSGRISKLQGKFAMAPLRNKLLFIDDDLDTGTRLPEGTLKLLTGNKLITAEIKFGGNINFISSIAIMMLANNPPATADLTMGFRRRIQIIPFDRVFTKEECDPRLFEIIQKKEMSGILNRALKGLKRLYQRGDFLVPQDCENKKEEWLTQANPLKAYLKERTVSGENQAIQLKVVNDNFHSWTSESRINYSMSPQRLKQSLISLGYHVDNKSGQNIVYGLSLK